MSLQRKVLGLNRKSLLCLITCLLLLLTSFAWNNVSLVPAAGGINALVVDQQQTTANFIPNIDTTGWWQSFTPSVDNIAGVSVYIKNHSTENPSGRYLSIMVDDASDGSTPLASSTIDVSGLAIDQFAWFNYTFTPVSITISSTYYIIVKDPTWTTPDDQFHWCGAQNNPYDGGMWSYYFEYDAAFKTYYDDLFPEFDTFMLLMGFTQLGLLLMVVYLVRKR